MCGASIFKVIIMAFGSQTDNVALINELAHRLNDNTRRIRVLEEKVRNLELQIGTHDQRIMEENKISNGLSQAIGEGMAQIKERIVGLEIEAQSIRTEIKKSAQKSDLKEVQEYIELISPVTSKYLTRGEVEEIVRQEVRKAIAKGNVR